MPYLFCGVLRHHRRAHGASGQAADRFAAAMPNLQSCARQDPLAFANGAQTDDVLMRAALLVSTGIETYGSILTVGVVQAGFQLGGVPSFIVIGPDGIVKWAKLGAPPSLKNDLISAVEKTLSVDPK